MKRAGFKVFLASFLLACAFCAGMLVVLIDNREAPVEITQPIVRVENLLVLSYEGQNYVVGFIDSLTNRAQVLNSEIISFLLSQASDKGIKEAAEYIGFIGPQTVQLKEIIPDAVPDSP